MLCVYTIAYIYIVVKHVYEYIIKVCSFLLWNNTYSCRRFIHVMLVIEDIIIVTCFMLFLEFYILKYVTKYHSSYLSQNRK